MTEHLTNLCLIGTGTCVLFLCSSLNENLSACIGTTNNLLSGGMVDVSSPDDATIICTFLCGFTGSTECTVHYGTDPTYINLPYSAESSETGTAGEFVSVMLRDQLNSSTEYYYTVSAVRENITVTVQRNFTTPQYSVSKYIAHCRKFVNILMTCRFSESKHTQCGNLYKLIISS